jgi:hypothetical protein
MRSTALCRPFRLSASHGRDTTEADVTKAVKMTIVVPDPERFDGRCPPAKLIRRLTRQRRLPSFA